MRLKAPALGRADRAFVQGMAAIAAAVARSGHDDICLNVLEGYGVTLKTFIDAGVEEFDLDALKAAGVPAQ